MDGRGYPATALVLILHFSHGDNHFDISGTTDVLLSMFYDYIYESHNLDGFLASRKQK